jgi:hypothetical protein
MSLAVKAIKCVECHQIFIRAKYYSVIMLFLLIFYELPMKYLELNSKMNNSIDHLNYCHLPIFLIKELKHLI